MTTSPKRTRYRKPVGSKLEKILAVVFGLFALLVVNAVYLTAIRVVEKVSGETYQNWFYILMFLGHLVLGLLIILPVIAFGIGHIRNAHNRPNKRAVQVGYALFVTALILLASGVVLTRVEGVIVVKDPAVRSVAYWLHVLTPLVAGWLFVLHRLAGRKIKWRIGARWAVVAAVFAGAMVVLQTQDPRSWNQEGPESGEQYFFPSLARTATGNFIPERVLMNDQYCQECHGDVHERWENGVHHLSSFNNPPYLASVRETRRVATVQAARFCAGCHDPVVFFGGKFDDPEFDDVNDPAGQAGITCTTCHAITHINSPRGNSDYTIEEPVHYPFAFSKNRTLAWTNRQLVKAKPDLHKKTFLKPLHKTPEFCGSCHKVHLPEELNNYKWLRGQNHYDPYHLSGVSGHGVSSFYYPPKAQANCNGCHMPVKESDDFGARVLDDTGVLKVHDHLFPSANTGIPHILNLPEWVNQAHADFNAGVMRVDLVGIRQAVVDGRSLGIEGPLTAPLRPEVPALEPGQSYLLETVVRTLKMGHLFTQGTADSNEVWVDVRVTDGAGQAVGRSGGLGEGNGVDPWSHFINAFVLDREGRRIDRRNAQDIFVALYSHQIPPGAADVMHYLLQVPPGVVGPLTVEVKLRYRKFDTTYMRFVNDDPGYVNDLPILTLASDRVVFPVAGQGAATASGEAASAPPPEPLWQRWNDYGIALLRQGALRQAAEAFHQVEALGRPDGPLNLARVYLEQGTVQDQAIAALERAAAFQDPQAPAWTVAWFTGLVNKQNGFLDEAIANFRSIVEGDNAALRERGFDFSQDYRVLNELAETLFERASQERGEAREAILAEAVGLYQRVLELDPENVPAHFNLARIYRTLGQEEPAAEHLALYRKYKPDDNARGQAINAARARYPAASEAANAIPVYDLQRPGAFEADGSRRAETFALGPVDSSPPQASLGGVD
jgi:tetratricopeptide (TPR) repeat protein